MSHTFTSNPTVVRYGRWRNQFIIAPVALVLGVLFWYKRDHSLGFWVAIVFLGALAVFSVLPSETRFNPGRGEIERRWSLFGVLPVFRHRLSLGQFHRICWHHIAGVEPGDWHTWMVGLERTTGPPAYVSYFNVTHDGLCKEAQQFAVELSKLTHLPLSDEIKAG